MKTHYDTLNVRLDADQEEISKAYKKLAKTYHPDMNPDSDAIGKFKEVAEAYEVLSDDRKRSTYDRSLNSGPNSGPGPMNGTFESIFRRWSQFSGDSEQVVNKGKSIRTSVRVTIDEVLTGCKKEVNYASQEACSSCKGHRAKSWEECSACNGSGMVTSQAEFASWSVRSNCSQCSGRGKIVKELCDVCNATGLKKPVAQVVEIDIPPGVLDQVQIRLEGLGAAGLSGSPNGDLYVVVNVIPNKNFKRDKCNLHSKIDVSYTQLLFGDSVDIDIVGGTGKLKIPPRTNSGARLRVKGKGLPLMERPNVIGDLFVQVNLLIPKELTKQEENVLKELAKLEKNNSDFDK